MIGEDKLIKFSGVPKENGNACSIVLRGASSHILAEAERSIHDALCVLTQTVQRNTKVVCGGGASEMVSQLRALHTKGKSDMGLNMNEGIVGDMKKLRVCESFKSKYQSLVSAHEAAEMILRVDDIVRAQPRQRVDPRQQMG